MWTKSKLKDQMKSWDSFVFYELYLPRLYILLFILSKGHFNLPWEGLEELLVFINTLRCYVSELDQ